MIKNYYLEEVSNDWLTTLGQPIRSVMDTVKQAVEVLEQHINVLHSVPEWAEQMGFNSTNYFSRKIRDYYGKRPKEIMVEVRLTAIRQRLAVHNDDTFFCIARDLGFVNDTALYKFVKWHTGKSLTELKIECENRV